MLVDRARRALVEAALLTRLVAALPTDGRVHHVLGIRSVVDSEAFCANCERV